MAATAGRAAVAGQLHGGLGGPRRASSRPVSTGVAALTLLAVVGVAPAPASAELPLNGSYTSLSQVWPALADLDAFSNNTSLGGRNLTRCCLYAVRESYTIVDGYIVQNVDEQSRFVNLSAWQLSEDQFPCGASYSGNDAGAPDVKISYWWCAANCGGWQKSSNTALSQWVQPFVGFILPAVVFCLNVSGGLASLAPLSLAPFFRGWCLQASTARYGITGRCSECAKLWCCRSRGRLCYA
jgi:hypothetical protein